MIFKRKVTDKLLDWKENYSYRYACLLEGARRVGKSTIAKNFVKENFKTSIIVDFSTVTEEVLDVFKDINDLDLFFLRLQNVMNVELIPHESCIVFDEIQLQPKVRQAIKHLVADGRYAYIETGSLISINKNIKNILIPSEEMKINVYPLDYEEFLMATGGSYENLKETEKLNLKLGSTNRFLMRNFRIYMAIGGMPQAVEAYINKESFSKIDKIKQEIIKLYMDDFRKIDSTGRISRLFDSIPAQLANNRKNYSINLALNKRNKTLSDEEKIYELIDSKTVLPCYNIKDPSILLSLNYDLNDFKLYIADTGLFTTMIFNNKELVSEDLYAKLLSDKLPANLGFLYENVIAQIIASTNQKLYYHTWRKANSTHSYEIDFLLSDKSKLVPIEVKSSETRNHESINAFSEKYKSRISRRILFSQDDLGNDGMLELKPIYLAPIIIEKFK